MLTTAQAAQLLGLETRTVSKLIRRNVLHAERFGERTWMISEQEVERYQKERRPAGWPKGRPRKDKPDQT